MSLDTESVIHSVFVLKNHVQGMHSANPEVGQSLTHEHVHNHHHGIDMEHPSLALSMMVLSIAVKEGYQIYKYWC